MPCWLTTFPKETSPLFGETGQLTGRPRSLDPAWIPPAILAWVDYPVSDLDLGDKILKQLAVMDGGI